MTRYFNIDRYGRQKYGLISMYICYSIPTLVFIVSLTFYIRCYTFVNLSTFENCPILSTHKGTKAHYSDRYSAWSTKASPTKFITFVSKLITIKLLCFNVNTVLLVSGGFVPRRFRPLEVSSHLFSYFPINTGLIHLVLKQHL